MKPRTKGAKSHKNAHCYKLANFVKLSSGNLKALQKVVRIIHSRSMSISVAEDGVGRKKSKPKALSTTHPQREYF